MNLTNNDFENKISEEKSNLKILLPKKLKNDSRDLISPSKSALTPMRVKFEPINKN